MAGDISNLVKMHKYTYLESLSKLQDRHKEIHTKRHSQISVFKEKNLESKEKEMIFQLLKKHNLNDGGILLRNQEARSKWHSIFQVLDKKTRTKTKQKLSTQNPVPVKTFSYEGKLRELTAIRSFLKTAQRKFSKQKGMIEEGILKLQEGRKNTAQICVNAIDLPCLLEFPTKCLTVQGKMIALFEVVLNVFKGIFNKIMLQMREDKGT